MPRNAACSRCALSSAAKTVCVAGTGSGRSGIMLLGEAPGQNEDELGKPFVGPAGSWLDKALDAAGLTRDDLFITNTVRCRPPNNRDPLPQEQQACFPYLAEEIDEVKPKVIVALGNAPLAVLTGQSGGISRQRGKLLKPAANVFIGDAQIVAAWHPAYVMRQGAKAFGELVNDLKIAAALVHPPEEQAAMQGLPPHERIILYPGYKLDDFITGLNRLKAVKWLSADLEWTDVNKKRDEMTWPWTPGGELLSMSFAGRTPEGILSIGFSWPPPPGGVAFLQQWLEGHLLVYHNALSDGVWMLHHKLPINLGGDTMGIPYLQDEEQPRSLEVLASNKAHVPPIYKHGDVEWNSAHFAARPTSYQDWERLLYRNTADTYATLLLHEAEVEEVKAMPEPQRSQLKRIYTREMLQIIPILCKMALKGAPMSITDLEHAIVEQREKLHEIVLGIAEPNKLTMEAAEGIARSPDQLKVFLKQAYKLDLVSTNKQTLSAIQSAYPVLEKVREYRHVRNKILGTYLEPWHDMLTRQKGWLEKYEDGAAIRIGWLHAIYGIWTRTGRSSARGEDGGNLHQMPREPWMRRTIIAPPGCKLIAADESMIELRTLAWQSGERNMIQLLREGVDLHATTAAFVSIAAPQHHLTMGEFFKRRDEFVKPLQAAIKAGDAKAKELRSRAKPVNFGMGYEQQPDGFIVYARSNYVDDDGNPIIFSPAEAIEAHRGYHQLYPDLNTYYNTKMEEAFRRGWWATPFGRYRRHFKERPEVTATSAQSPAADILWLAIIAASAELERRHLRCFLFAQIHDSILAVAKEEDADEAADVIRQAMERPPTEWLGLDFAEIPVPLVADISQSDRWKG